MSKSHEPIQVKWRFAPESMIHRLMSNLPDWRSAEILVLSIILAKAFHCSAVKIVEEESRAAEGDEVGAW